MKSKVIYIPQSLNQSASVEVEKLIDEQLAEIPSVGTVNSIVPVGEDKVIVFYTPGLTTTTDEVEGGGAAATGGPVPGSGPSLGGM